jgi:CRP/FNR family cyclic AMP-dependent transcriptional regulator
MANEQIAALRRMALCSALSAAELDVIAAIVEKRDVAAGKELFREGEPGDGLYLLVTGEINVIKLGKDGEHLLAKLGPGAVLGEMSLITSDARSATGRALAQSSVLRLPAAEFRALLESGSVAALKIAAAIAGVLARRLATMNSLVLGLAAQAGSSAPRSSSLNTQDLRELHRTLQVWSF